MSKTSLESPFLPQVANHDLKRGYIRRLRSATAVVITILTNSTSSWPPLQDQLCLLHTKVYCLRSQGKPSARMREGVFVPRQGQVVNFTTSPTKECLYVDVEHKLAQYYS